MTCEDTFLFNRFQCSFIDLSRSSLHSYLSTVLVLYDPFLSWLLSFVQCDYDSLLFYQIHSINADSAKGKGKKIMSLLYVCEGNMV